MPNIFAVNNWEDGKIYKTHDIVLYPINGKKRYFYAAKDHTSSTSPTSNAPALGSAFWAGQVFYAVGNVTKPNFVWRPSYNLVVNSSPSVIVTKFSDGYEQRTVDGINNLLLIADLTFEGRDSKEAAAILHFFSSRRGQESFVLTLPHPYDLQKLYVCRDWSNNYAFYNNYSIRAKLDEVTS